MTRRVLSTEEVILRVAADTVRIMEARHHRKPSMLTAIDLQAAKLRHSNLIRENIKLVGGTDATTP